MQHHQFTFLNCTHRVRISIQISKLNLNHARSQFFHHRTNLPSARGFSGKSSISATTSNVFMRHTLILTFPSITGLVVRKFEEQNSKVILFDINLLVICHHSAGNNSCKVFKVNQVIFHNTVHNFPVDTFIAMHRDISKANGFFKVDC